jgi:hypothetical protein
MLQKWDTPVTVIGVLWIKGVSVSLRDEIVPYKQTTGLVSNVVSIGQHRTCDNGPLFTAEYIILLHLVNESTFKDDVLFDLDIHDCSKGGYLHRAPDDTSPDAPDDHHGVLAAYNVLGLKPPFKVPFSLWRQPQILALWFMAQRNLFYRIIATPLIAYSALVIATSCIGDPTSDTDGRILSWCLLKGLERSWLCQLGGWFWKRRLMSDYPNGMKDVFTIYFGPDHPLSKYMVRY